MALKLEAQIALDGSGFQAGLNKVTAGIGQLKSMFGAAFTVGAFVSATKSVINFASELKDTATRLDISTDSLQEFGFSARQSGSTLKALTTGLERLGQSMFNAMGEGQAAEKMAESFKTLGVSLNEIRRSSPDDLFRKIGDNLRSINTNSAEVKSAIRDVFGRGGGGLITVLKELRENAELFKETQPLITETSINNAERFGDKMDALKDKMKSYALTVFDLKEMLSEGSWVDQLNALNVARQRQEENELNQKRARREVGPGIGGLNIFTFSDLLGIMFDNLDLKPSEKDKYKFKRVAMDTSLPQPDSLVRVGNFLGSSQNAIVQIGERTNRLLTSIDRRLAAMSTGSSFPST